MPSSGRWKRSTARRGECLPLRPGGRLLPLEPLEQLRRDEADVEDDGLVVGAVGHADRDQRAQAEVAVGRDDRVDRLLGEARELVEEVDDAGRAGAEHLDPAEQRADVDLARRTAPARRATG